MSTSTYYGHWTQRPASCGENEAWWLNTVLFAGTQGCKCDGKKEDSGGLTGELKNAMLKRLDSSEGALLCI
ncbi:hypothetical protein PAXRUDRAFT_821071 [Paxillus rubicundulus Ve08.2h10]|uniref:Uncharacterized protein n=1 Tax=Paxillus rubicundulus Ve08.2h10 TaxID=930991 RepID=A0A0D0DYU5_9AGAM|nr:hypothetical protein PAXRUDRAFT_821071 [Paxillus rubicundulus Ve08.2h10]